MHFRNTDPVIQEIPYSKHSAALVSGQAAVEMQEWHSNTKFSLAGQRYQQTRVHSAQKGVAQESALARSMMGLHSEP